MEISELENKISEVKAIARVVVQQYGHTKKFAKHLVAFAINGGGNYKSKTPKDPDYGKRWAIERIFSRLKEVFGLSKNRFVGIKNVAVHTYSCLVAYLIKYVM